ncbi:NUDIX domain-containing protein [archaeon]|jgi:putative (di)nucleoside polyphosphate hydrolase|nr:NUDIX domain-containing protein [archaeon]MBT5287990.1 NUDIX domain-containing protein [archaeon]
MRSRNTVLGLFLNEEGEVLIGFSERINSGNSKVVDSHSWKFPQGGVDEGEKSYDALIRELNEELNLKITKEKFDITELGEKIPYYFFDENGLPDFEVKLYPYLIKYKGDNNFKFNKEEFSGLKWLKPQEICNLNLGIRKNAYIVILKKFGLLN